MTAAADQVNDLLLKLEPDWGRKQVEALRVMHALGDEDRKARIERMAVLGCRTAVQDSFLGDQVLLPPSTAAECRGNGEVFLGDVCYGQNPDGSRRSRFPLFLNFEDVKNHAIVTGLSGVGKTTLAYNLLIELASKNINCIVFDWDRTWRNLFSLPKHKYPFISNMRIYTVGRDEVIPFSWNMFFSPPAGVKFTNWLGIASSKPLQKSLMAGQGVEDYLENEAEELMALWQKGMLRLLPNMADIKERLKARFAKARQLLWKQSAERVLKELTRECVCEVFGSREPMDISEEILERKGVTIIELDLETPEHLRVLFQELLLTYFVLHHLHKGEADRDELRTVIIAEEFPNMLPKSKIERETGGEILRNLFREGRKFGVGLVAIAQESSELPNYVTANCKIQAHFALQTKRDIEAGAGSLFLKKHQLGFLDLIWRGEAIVKVKGRVRNCLVKIPPPPPMTRVTDKQLRGLSEEWLHQN